MRIRTVRPPVSRIPAAPLAGFALVALLAAIALGAASEERGLRLGIARRGEGPSLPSGDGAVFVAVLPDGSLLVDGEPLPLSALSGRLARGESSGSVVLGATDETPYEAVVAALDALASLPSVGGAAPRVLLPTRAMIAEQAKRVGRDPFAPRAAAR